MEALTLMALMQGIFKMYLQLAEMVGMSKEQREAWEAKERADFEERGPKTL